MWERSADVEPFSLNTMTFSANASELCFKCRRKVLRETKNKKRAHVCYPLFRLWWKQLWCLKQLQRWGNNEVTCGKQSSPAAVCVHKAARLFWLSGASCEDLPCRTTSPRNALCTDWCHSQSLGERKTVKYRHRASHLTGLLDNDAHFGSAGLLSSLNRFS